MKQTRKGREMEIMDNYFRTAVLQRIAAILFSASFLAYNLPFIKVFFVRFNGFGLIESAILYDDFEIGLRVILIAIIALSAATSIIGFSAVNSRGALGVMAGFGLGAIGLWFLWIFIVASDVNSLDFLDLFSGVVEPLGGFWVFLAITVAAVVLSLVAHGLYHRESLTYVSHGGILLAGHKGREEKEASIVCVAGMYKGAVFPLPDDEVLVFGRDAKQCHIIISENSEKISRKHLTISFDPYNGVYVVTDNSSNGTYLSSGSRLASNIPVELRRGTTIYLAKRNNSFTLT